MTTSPVTPVVRAERERGGRGGTPRRRDGRLHRGQCPTPTTTSQASSTPTSWWLAPALDMASTDFVDPYLDPETGLLRNLVGARDDATLVAAEGVIRTCAGRRAR